MAISRSIHYDVIGQSYGREGYSEQPAHWAFSTAIGRVLDADPATVQANIGSIIAAGDRLQLRNLAVDGSAILQANAGTSGHWVNNAGTSGPLLTAAVAAITGYAKKPLITIHSHGEQESGITSDAQALLVKAALTDVLWPAIRTALSAGNPNGVPIWFDMLGPRFPDQEFGEYFLRDRFIEAIDATTRVFRGAEKYALQLDATVHPSEMGYRQMGAHTGREAAAWLLNTSGDLRGPTITNPVRAGNNVTVTISVPAGKTLVKPTSPDFFGLFNNLEQRIAITGFSWNGNDLTINGAGPATKLRYPCPTGRKRVDIGRIIRLSNPLDPIYPAEPGLVLESMKTHTF